ncbi:hypothetical protein GW17_00059354 [Ensete ventricosum]|nr:hypothetical protein GW17_00059354 [Ensete ventricosum]
MNGIHGPALSTIHVTPEDGFSYASYEAMVFNPHSLNYHDDLIERVLRCFGPSEFSVAVTIFAGHGLAATRAKKVDLHGYARNEELPGDGLLVYQTFAASFHCDSGVAEVHPASLGRRCYCWKGWQRRSLL